MTLIAKFMLLLIACQGNRDPEGTVLVPEKSRVQEQRHMNVPKLQLGDGRDDGCARWPWGCTGEGTVIMGDVLFVTHGK